MCIGGEFPRQGLGYHWEIWTLASGGTTPIDVLRAATIFGADAIGHGKNVGSIEPGKFADLVVMNANPLENIMNTNSVAFVMKNGRLYDDNSLNEVYPRQKVLAKGWWTDPHAVSSSQNLHDH